MIMYMATPLSLEELKRLRSPIKNVHKEARAKLSRLQQFALWITKHVGSMGFFIILLIWTIGWLGWNLLAPFEHRFDPFPAFALWSFIANLLQIILLPLIMEGQNIQNRHAEVRANAEFELGVKTEREMETILLHLENQNETMVRILKRLEDNK